MLARRELPFKKLLSHIFLFQRTVSESDYYDAAFDGDYWADSKQDDAAELSSAVDDHADSIAAGMCSLYHECVVHAEVWHPSQEFFSDMSNAMPAIVVACFIGVVVGIALWSLTIAFCAFSSYKFRAKKSAAGAIVKYKSRLASVDPSDGYEEDRSVVLMKFEGKDFDSAVSK
jgi:hypothetical protein